MMKKSVSKLLCALALSSVFTASALAAGNDVDIWVSKLFTLPTPSVSSTETGLTVTVENPGLPYGLDCQIGVALYDSDGRMLGSQFVSPKQTENYTFDFEAVGTAAKVKLFVFEASAGFKPIYEASQAVL